MGDKANHQETAAEINAAAAKAAYATEQADQASKGASESAYKEASQSYGSFYSSHNKKQSAEYLQAYTADLVKSNTLPDVQLGWSESALQGNNLSPSNLNGELSANDLQKDSKLSGSAINTLNADMSQGFLANNDAMFNRYAASEGSNGRVLNYGKIEQDIQGVDNRKETISVARTLLSGGNSSLMAYLDNDDYGGPKDGYVSIQNLQNFQKDYPPNVTEQQKQAVQAILDGKVPGIEANANGGFYLSDLAKAAGFAAPSSPADYAQADKSLNEVHPVPQAPPPEQTKASDPTKTTEPTKDPDPTDKPTKKHHHHSYTPISSATEDDITHRPEDSVKEAGNKNFEHSDWLWGKHLHSGSIILEDPNVQKAQEKGHGKAGSEQIYYKDGSYRKFGFNDKGQLDEIRGLGGELWSLKDGKWTGKTAEGDPIDLKNVDFQFNSQTGEFDMTWVNSKGQTVYTQTDGSGATRETVSPNYFVQHA